MSDEVKKLYRSKEDRWLGGVCGGIAAYFNIDAIIVRILFILLALAIGGGILIYVILWIIIPAEPDNLVGKADAFAETDAGDETDAAGESEKEA